MTQSILPSLGPISGPGFRSLFDSNRSSDAPAGLDAVLGSRGAGLPEAAERLLRDTQRLFDDSGSRPGNGAAATGEPVGNNARGIGSVFDVGDLIDKVGDVLSKLAKQLFGALDLPNLLKGLQDQVKNVLTAPFDGRAGNLATAGSAFVSFQGVEISFETDGSHTSLHIKQTSVETAYGFGATADGSLAYRLGSFSSETNELDIDLYARGDETAVTALFKHTSLDVVAVQAVQRGPVAIGDDDGRQPVRDALAPVGQRRDSLVDRFLDLLAPPPPASRPDASGRDVGAGELRRPVQDGDNPSKPRALIVIDVPKSKIPVVEGGRLKLSLDMLLPIDLRVRELAKRAQSEGDRSALATNGGARADGRRADLNIEV
ncbi:MAG: hypothetical protein FJX35_11180 [Alphaproteobacteria bacterium]|nr:hypothetical protein [Alphaproteobacteria bacterium]